MLEFSILDFGPFHWDRKKSGKHHFGQIVPGAIYVPLAPFTSWRCKEEKNASLQTMNTKLIVPIAFLILVCLFLVWEWYQTIVRKRYLATIKAMAESERNDICGKPMEYWLNILNQDRPQPIVAVEAMVLMYRGLDYFFIDGGIGYLSRTWRLEKAFFLIAVSRPAVDILSEQKQVFRLIAGSSEMAAFSIYLWTAFTQMLKEEKKICGIQNCESDTPYIVQ
jgi:hypothetical protein